MNEKYFIFSKTWNATFCKKKKAYLQVYEANWLFRVKSLLIF